MELVSGIFDKLTFFSQVSGTHNGFHLLVRGKSYESHLLVRGKSYTVKVYKPFLPKWAF